MEHPGLSHPAEQKHFTKQHGVTVAHESSYMESPAFQACGTHAANPGLLDVSTEKSETLSAILCCVEVRGPQRGTFMVPGPPGARHIRSFSLVETDGGGGWGGRKRGGHIQLLCLIL